MVNVSEYTVFTSDKTSGLPSVKLPYVKTNLYCPAGRYCTVPVVKFSFGVHRNCTHFDSMPCPCFNSFNPVCCCDMRVHESPAFILSLLIITPEFLIEGTSLMFIQSLFSCFSTFQKELS